MFPLLKTKGRSLIPVLRINLNTKECSEIDMEDKNIDWDEKEPRMEAPQLFYHVRARTSCDTPDPAAERERMLVCHIAFETSQRDQHIHLMRTRHGMEL